MRFRNFGLLGLSLLCAAGQPKVIAHRGGAALRPENTIAAFQHSLKLGVPVLEFDMNVTADDQIVIHHDSTVNPAICKARPGSSVTAGPIRLLTLAQIRQFDCGSFARPNSPHFQPVPEQRMPTLDEFLTAVKGSKGRLLGETKMPPPGSKNEVSPERFVQLIDAIIRKHKVADRFILQSTDYRTIDAMHAKNPAVQLCPLNARQFKPAYLDVAQKHKATYLMLRADDLTKDQAAKLHAAGIQLYSGTANTPADWAKYVELGMDGILTDDPEGLAQFLKTDITRMYVFGDSYSDMGAGYIDGDGPTAVGYLAERLGFPLVASTAPDSAGKSLNFAVSGAGTGSGSGRKVKDALLGLGMRNQVDDFASRVRSGAVKFTPESTLFYIAGGLNDRRLTTETTIANLKGEIRTLYELGGRRFMVALLPTAIPAFSEVGLRLNPALSRLPQEVAPELPGATVTLSQWGPHFDEVMHKPADYGIRNTTDACAGRAIFNENATPCSAPAAYYYYHAGHPSTAVHKAVGEMLYRSITRSATP